MENTTKQCGFTSISKPSKNYTSVAQIAVFSSFVLLGRNDGFRPKNYCNFCIENRILLEKMKFESSRDWSHVYSRT